MKEKGLIIMETKKKWFIITIFASIGVLLCILLAMVIVDPYFQYHGKVPGIRYRLYNERYINSGIVEHFEYDAVITGSSMNQNFKTSQLDEILGTNSVKVPFSGGGFQEIMQNLERAFNSGNEIDYVLWGVDYNCLLRERYYKAYESYPDYLYDDNILNDVSYVWNKELIFQGLVTDLLMTLQGEEDTTFDEYTSWEAGRGWESISKTYQRSEEILPMQDAKLSELEEFVVRDNIGVNIADFAKAHPDTQFILFYPPYSALYWESIYRDGTLLRQLECERISTELLLECENVKLYNFHDKTEITSNLEYYRDKEHYTREVNEMILQWIAEGDGLVTKENYMDIIEWERDYYMNYDYDRLYE